jgi:hypothetical protein
MGAVQESAVEMHPIRQVGVPPGLELDMFDSGLWFID